MSHSVLFSEKQIQNKIQQLAKQVNDFYGKDELLAIGILTGAFRFYTDLLKQLEQDIRCDFCSVSFYGSSQTASAEASLSYDVKSPVKGKRILLIDCIADHGHSIHFVKQHLKNRQAKQVKTIALITKPKALQKTTIDFKGFSVKQDVFVMGYGIDYNSEGRELNYFSQKSLI